uniref:Amino acid transporter transmembrane domain-containing protein n=1 Tax=Plectus sambesii TaxID=2011161 RepID=A0A914WMU9_9BILA
MSQINEAEDHYSPISHFPPINDDDENTPLVQSIRFDDRPHNEHSLSPETALIHMMKAMLGTGMLSLPLAFKHSGLWLGLVLLLIICAICLYCMRLLVYAANYVCSRNERETVDYANVMRAAVESGPPWLNTHGYAAKQLVNATMFIAQLGFCCVYFVFMADNLKQFFDENSQIRISQAGWIAMLLIPILGLCSIRHLSELAPLSFITNFMYVIAVSIVAWYLFTDPLPSSSLPAVGNWRSIPLFLGTVMFSFEGVAVVMPIENRMDQPQYFIARNGVLNTACLLVAAIYAVVGFYGYLKFGDAVADTVTLNLPSTAFYQTVKLMFVVCVMVSYPLQFYVPLERIEKFISRKAAPAKQFYYIYGARAGLVLVTCAIAELIPHLALFISLIGSVASTGLALGFPPFIDLLVHYSKRQLTAWVWARNVFLLVFALFGFITANNETVDKEDVVRQCRCGSETEQCFAVLGVSLAICSENCGGILQEIGDPEKLMKCFVDQHAFGELVKTCALKRGGLSCYEEKEAEPPLIHRVNLRKQFEAELNEASKLGAVFRRHPLLKNLTSVIKTMGEYSLCLNNCSNSGRQYGSCFSDDGCQLKKVSTNSLLATVFQCSISVDNGQIVEACYCLVDAGVSIAPLCSIVSLYLDKNDLGSGLEKTSYKP